MYSTHGPPPGDAPPEIQPPNPPPVPPPSPPPVPPPPPPPCNGMPIWGVAEPNIALWLADEPLGYQPAIGPRISLELTYKQREQTAGMDTNTFSAGKGWNFSWFSYAALNTAGSNTVHLSNGMETSFPNGTNYVMNARMTGNITDGFTISYSDGSKDVYGFIAHQRNASARLSFGALEYLGPEIHP